MGRLFTVSLEGEIYTCKYCSTHLALQEDILSRYFLASHGEAYFFKKVVNVTMDKLLDGTRARALYAFDVIFCVGCEAKMGFTYIEDDVSGSQLMDPGPITKYVLVKVMPMMLEQ